MKRKEPLFVFDFINWAGANPAQYDKIRKRMAQLDAMIVDKRGNPMRSESYREISAEIIKLSKFNFGMLIPHVFPTLNKGNPMTLNARPFMYAMMCFAPRSIITLKAGRQVGKCATGDTTVDTQRGRMQLRELFELGQASD